MYLVCTCTWVCTCWEWNCWIVECQCLRALAPLHSTNTWFVFVFSLVILVGVCILWSAWLSFALFFFFFCPFFYWVVCLFLLFVGYPFIFWVLVLCQIFILWISFSILWFALSLFTCFLRNGSLYNPVDQIFLCIWCFLGNVKKYLPAPTSQRWWSVFYSIKALLCYLSYIYLPSTYE